MNRIICLALMMFFVSSSIAQINLTPLDEGSKVHFVIRNFGINTGGDLTGLKGTIKLDRNKPANSLIDATVNAATIDTENDRRDAHLKRADFFDAEKFPLIRITSQKIEAGKALNEYIFHGTVTIKTFVKPIQFPFTVVPKDGITLLEGSFELNRLDFELGGKSATMGDDVKVILSVLAK